MGRAIRDLVVQKSKIHGRGVFAARAFKKGEVVLEWDLRRKVKKADIPKLPTALRRNVYFYRGRYIVPSSPGRYLNHSCDANTVAVNGFDVAARNIQPGEEVTVNFLAEEILGMDFICTCGSPRCRGRSLRRSVSSQQVRK